MGQRLILSIIEQIDLGNTQAGFQHVPSLPYLLVPFDGLRIITALFVNTPQVILGFSIAPTQFDETFEISLGLLQLRSLKREQRQGVSKLGVIGSRLLQDLELLGRLTIKFLIHQQTSVGETQIVVGRVVGKRFLQTYQGLVLATQLQ